jgi:hypothetical protein
MATIQYGLSVNGSGVSIQGTIARTADGLIGVEPTVNAAKALGAWVKGVGAGDATATLTGGHGWSTGVGDVYWTGGRRYDVTVTISTNAVTLAAGSGDTYPATADATVKLAMHQQVNQIIDGDLLELLALDAAAFKARFACSPVLRTKRRGLLRNVCVALGNVAGPEALLHGQSALP